MERKVSSKIYEVSLFATAIFALLNIVGVWVTWMTLNPFGYVTGALLLVGLIASGVLSILNEKAHVRKQWIVWLICLCVHIIFFVLVCVLINPETADYTIPALFTVMIVAILGALIYFFIRNRYVVKNKPYVLTPTVANEGTDQNARFDDDVVQKTVKIKVDQQQDNIPVADFKPEDLKKVDDQKDQSNEPSGVIKL